jgi:L-2-hydroxyglutarate oxidase LhgO
MDNSRVAFAERSHKPFMTTDMDILIVGGGLVGLATAMHLQKMRPRSKIVVLEKRSMISDQQSGNNSGVLHAGLYYEPGSLKARLCVLGGQSLGNLCERLGLPIRRCGKVVVAQNDEESRRLEWLLDRGTENGVPGLRLIGLRELREIEPNVDAQRALHVPSSAIVDYRLVAGAYAALFERSGGEIMLSTEFHGGEHDGTRWLVETSAGVFRTKLVVNCAGLHADVVAKSMGSQPEVQVIPFRGEYYLLKEERRDLVNGLVYPVPNPKLPFLGVHFTPRISGDVEAGPNAILATRREGYHRSDFDAREFAETLSYPGFWKLAARNVRPGLGEIYRSLSKKAFVRALQDLVPDIGADDLVPGGAGVRAMAVDRQGNMVDDFYFEEAPGAIHVLNAPSPAATSSFMIGKHVANKADLRLNAD